MDLSENKIISLDDAETYSARVFEHVKRLSVFDRYSRFQSMISDSVLQEYCKKIDYECDIVLGYIGDSGRIIGLVHSGCYLENGELTSELGLTVDQAARRSGIGGLLLSAALACAQERGVSSVHINFLKSNSAMISLVKSTGTAIDIEDQDCNAVIRMQPAVKHRALRQ